MNTNKKINQCKVLERTVSVVYMLAVSNQLSAMRSHVWLAPRVGPGRACQPGALSWLVGNISLARVFDDLTPNFSPETGLAALTELVSHSRSLLTTTFDGRLHCC